jgi:hypothetical protein
MSRAILPWLIILYFIGLMVAAHYWQRLKEPKVKTGRFRRPR